MLSIISVFFTILASWRRAEGNSVIAASFANKSRTCVVPSVWIRTRACVIEWRSCGCWLRLVRSINVTAAVTWRACKCVWWLAESGHVGNGAEDRFAMLWTGRISWSNRCDIDAHSKIVSVLMKNVLSIAIFQHDDDERTILLTENRAGIHCSIRLVLR